jgi:hypothetical protein
MTNITKALEIKNLMKKHKIKWEEAEVLYNKTKKLDEWF